MKPVRFVFSGIVLLLAVTWVQAREKLPEPKLPALEPLPVTQVQIFSPGGDLISAKGLDKLQLTKEQKADYDKLSDEFKKKQKELTESLFDINKKPDPASIKARFEAQQKLRPDYLVKVEKLLTDDQKKTFEEVRRERPVFGPGGGGVFPVPMPMLPFGSSIGGPFLPANVQKELKLTDDQKKKVDELQKELEAKIMTVLTEDQKKAFEEMKKRPPGGLILPSPIELPKSPLELPKLPAPGADKQLNPVPPALDPARPPELKKLEK